MKTLCAGLFLVPLIDQALKYQLRLRLGEGGVSLGGFGDVRIVTARIWWTRWTHGPGAVATWSLWLLSAIPLALATALVPSFGWFAGLLLGGSLSHGLENSLRGGISDYVCLRFWPAFNLADVAIVAGALGLMREVSAIVLRTW
jgi:hypothetical protein